MTLYVGSIETACGTAAYFIEGRGINTQSLDMIKDIPYKFKDGSSVLTSFWKLTTALNWNANIDDGRSGSKKDGKWTIKQVSTRQLCCSH